MVAPSLLFHEITSCEPRAQRSTCAVMFVSFRTVFAPRDSAASDATGDTYTSPSVDASAPTKATVCPSGGRLKPEAANWSAGAYVRTAFVAGSMLNRYAAVRCEALKKIPEDVQRTM